MECSEVKLFLTQEEVIALFTFSVVFMTVTIFMIFIVH